MDQQHLHPLEACQRRRIMGLTRPGEQEIWVRLRNVCFNNTYPSVLFAHSSGGTSAVKHQVFLCLNELAPVVWFLISFQHSIVNRRFSSGIQKGKVWIYQEQCDSQGNLCNCKSRNHAQLKIQGVLFFLLSLPKEGTLGDSVQV